MDEELRKILPDPVQIVANLDKYIIGQEDAKQNLAIMLFQRAVSMLQKEGHIDIETPIEKANVLLLGPTGSGKTALMKALSEIQDIPISINDVTQITSAGYVGGKVEDILVNHYETAKEWTKQVYAKYTDDVAEDLRKPYGELLTYVVENGVVFIDEIDKIYTKDTAKDITGDIIQNELLKFLEGSEINVQVSNRNSRSLPEMINTKGIIFICAGAFAGLSDIIYKRLNKNTSIGFNSDMGLRQTKDSNKEDLLRYVTTEDLIEYGFKPEFLGRIPLKAALQPLTVDALKRIITEPKNSIFSQYEALFEVVGIKLKFEEEAFEEIAKKTQKLKMGARSLRSIFNDVLKPELYNILHLDTEELVITKEVVRERCK